MDCHTLIQSLPANAKLLWEWLVAHATLSLWILTQDTAAVLSWG